MSDLDPDTLVNASENAAEQPIPSTEPQPKANGNGQEPPPAQNEAPEAEAEADGEAKPEKLTKAERDALLEQLAAMDPVAFGLIAKAEAAKLGITATELKDAVRAARSEARKAQTRTENDAKRARKEAEAEAEKAAREKERTDKKAEAEAKKQADADAKKPPPVTAAQIKAEIERLAKLEKAEFYAERDNAAWRLGLSVTELTTDVRAAKAKYAREHAMIPPFVTEQDVMRAFVTQFDEDLRFNHSSNSWLGWSKHHWKPDQRKRAFYWALELCKQMSPTHNDDGRAVVEKVRFSDAIEKGARVIPPMATAQSDWDKDVWLMGTPGGVVELKTGILRPGKRSDMITMTTAITPADNEDCPLWLKFLAEAAGSKEMVGFLKRYFGYDLTGLTDEEIILYLFGPGGAGKGTVVKTITAIMGDYAITTPIELFTEQSLRSAEYYRAKMVSKRLLVAAETERGSYWSESFVKAISGGDQMSGRHPAGQPFDFEPTHKPLIHANHMPKLRGPSSAMERRLRVAPFTRKPANPDTKLKEKLRAEWPGILRWMINGCVEWQRDGLNPPASIIGASKAYFDAQDALGRWIEDRCTPHPNKKIPPTVLRTDYNNWAKANGEEEMDGNAFAEAIDQFEGARLTRGKTGSNRWIKGLDLKPKPTGKLWWQKDDDGSDADEPDDA